VLTRRVIGLPILWMFLGPPILRPPSGRTALDSISGNFDVWNVVRLGWWTFFALLALVSLYRHRRDLAALVRTMPQLALWSGVWVASIVVSSTYSPASTFTLANSGVMAMLVVAALDLGVRIYARSLAVREVLSGLYLWSVVLVAFIGLSFALDPYRVSTVGFFGLRILGGHVADAPLLSTTLFFLAASFSIVSRGRAKWLHHLVMAAAFALLLLTQTRTAYIAFALGAGYLFLQWFLEVPLRARLSALGATLIVAGLFPVGVTLVDTWTGRSSVGEAFSYLMRDESSWRTASGRTTVSEIILERVGDRPWGLGYSAGPRVVLQSSISELAEQGVRAAGIGNAHNMYLEVLGGSGVIGLFSFLAVIVWVFLNMHRTQGPELKPVRVLFIVCLLGGFTGSSGVLPFFQASVLIWVIVGIVAGANGLTFYRARHI
jgi:O-antigen ligase